MDPETPQPQQPQPPPPPPPLDKREFRDRFASKFGEWQKRLPAKKASSGQADLEPEPDRVETESTEPTYGIYGFENEIKSLENFLLNRKVYKEFKSLVIVGEYGVGKTALCQKIFNQVNVKSVYAPRIWISMHSKETKSGEDTKISVLKRILKVFGVEDTLLDFIHKEAIEEASNNQEHGENDTSAKTEISALLYALHLNLRWKKYLIVFDDVRKEDDWNEILQHDEKKRGNYLADGFPKGSGGRVIYTTRDNDVADKLVAEKDEIHRLWPLTDSRHIWGIYEASHKEFLGREPPRNNMKCIDELMNKSRGLPLAARLLGKLDPVFLDDEKIEEESDQRAAESENTAS